jgi:hypothetical protein
MNQLELEYIYTREQHEEIPCVVLASIMFLVLSVMFFLLQNREQEVRGCGWHQWERGKWWGKG